MPIFYKGVGLGTFLHSLDLRTTGITPRDPTARYNINAVMRHVASATTMSPCISLTRSYGVAEEYAVNASRAIPTMSSPSYVYEIEIDDPPPLGVTIIDPILEVSRYNSNPLAQISFHHDGDMSFLLAVVDPIGMAAHLNTPIRLPRGSLRTPKTATLTIELETLVRSLRDAEVLALGSLPRTCVINRHPVY